MGRKGINMEFLMYSLFQSRCPSFPLDSTSQGSHTHGTIAVKRSRLRTNRSSSLLDCTLLYITHLRDVLTPNHGRTLNQNKLLYETKKDQMVVMQV